MIEPARFFCVEGNDVMFCCSPYSRLRSTRSTSTSRFRYCLLLLAVTGWPLVADPAPAPQESSGTPTPDFSGQNLLWLAPATSETVQTTTSHSAGDPFPMLNQSAFYQIATTNTETQKVAPASTLSYSTSTVSFDPPGAAPSFGGGFVPDTLSQQQKVDLLFAPSTTLTLRGAAWSGQDALDTGNSTSSRGVSLQTETPLPGTARLSLGISRAQVGPDTGGMDVTTTQASDAALTQPLGFLPLEAELKAHVAVTQSAAAEPTHLPSLEQALVWHPESEATLRLGLRQQEYQAYPGVTPGFNEVMFADWQQHLRTDLSWHSYVEVIDSRDAIATAPLVTASTGANGNPPPSTSLPGSSLIGAPSPFSDNSFTLSTGPSFQLKDDLSANLEYSNRWDQSSLSSGNTGAAEQRVSLSIKGSF